MKRLTTIMTLLLAISAIGIAQQIGPIEHSKGFQAYGTKEFKKVPKKLYIEHFFINYQLMADKSETAQGGRQLGGGLRGDAKARLVLGVPNISLEELQANTDRIYQEYLKQLKAGGVEIVSADEAANTEHYAGFERVKGGTPSMAQSPGYVSTVPTGMEFFFKKITKKGKGKSSVFDTGRQISKDLGVIAARIYVTIPVFEDGESQGSKALTKSFGKFYRANLLCNTYCRYCE